MGERNKSFAQGISDEISLYSIEQFANRLMIKYETALKQETVDGTVSDIGIGFELSIAMLKVELSKARKELDGDM